MKKTRKDNPCQTEKVDSIGELAGGVADDFNNILTVIIGACSLLEMNAADNPEQMQCVSRIRSYAERAALLTQSLMAFSWNETLSLQTENLTEVFREMLEFLAQIIGNDIQIATHQPEHALMVMVDRRLVEQVLMQLVTHFRDAMPKGGVLTIALSQVCNNGSIPELKRYLPGAYALVTFSGTGRGFDRITLLSMFEPYVASGEPGKHRSLGLTVAQGVITRHGGVISIRSELGNGTSLDIYLPLCDRGDATR